MRKRKNNDTDLLYELVRTNFKLRYNNSFLGFVWVLLKPFLTFLVLYVIFSSFRSNSDINNFTIYLLSGVMMFSFMNEGIIFGMNSLLDRANIILKVNFNRVIAVVSSVVMAVVNFIINILILGAFIIFNPVSATPVSILFFVFIILIMTALIMGLSYFMSIILIRFRDLKNISELLLQLLFYGSAIFYPIEMIPLRVRWLVEINPIYILIHSGRQALISGEIVLLDKVLIIAAIALVLLVTGTFYFNKKVKRVAEFF